MRSIWVAYSLLVTSILIMDRLSKMWARIVCADEYSITSWASCHVMYNRGISWSFLDFADTGAFIGISVVVGIITLMVTGYAYQRYRAGYYIFAPLAVIAGSVSNLIDRYLYAGVVDFIVVHYKTWSYPTFNIADMAIVIGVVCMVYQQSKDS